ncbi:hypothetical protein C900_02297 [Fulvivirga imtechensis AK7]|uniref:DUF4007 domain-containing protein n=1 Tax=Fulvivirga imtechensis AK7 TaxID=1237149 RepID=L8JWY1_9BACT|nr:DUF4007 family protein [Fulvivirga imtechensis]ELR71712.1 hypothetical protein C900_02297 [Fulvivirga imtechensis AK7]
MEKLRFSGHESFHCRHFWLKKGYDFISSGRKISDVDATSKLGVGKNMVSSIGYWLKAFTVTNDDYSTTDLAEFLFGENGKDPFLEDIGTLWLLQYYLVSSGIASIYPLVFKEFRKKHLNSQFSARQLEFDIKRELQKYNLTVADKTIQNDIKVFLNSYVVSSKKRTEDDLSAILIDLNLIEKVEDHEYRNDDPYKLNITERSDIPFEIMAFAILDQFADTSLSEDISISFDEIQLQVADCFACNREGLEQHIGLLQDKYPWIVYKEDAGRKEIQLKNGYEDKWKLLSRYYA